MWYKFAQKQSEINIPIPPILQKILEEIKQNGGNGYLIGGIVRDAIYNKYHGTNIPSKDYDVEVFRLPYDKLISILQKYGQANEVGKAFSVIKLTAGDEDYDFSLPRRDSKQSGGVGHKDFDIEADPNISEAEAGARRDVSVNSLLFDPLSGSLVDSFGGEKDIANKTLRHINEQFTEDPLRVMRLISLGSRFGMNIAPETAELAKQIIHTYKYLPKERILEEFRKIIHKSPKPGQMIKLLQQTGWDEAFPQIAALKGTPQDEIYHPEGDADTHTSHVMNEAARIASEKNLSPEEREVLIYSALAHDFAKPATTKTIFKNGRPTITSYDHERQGGPMAREFLQSIGVNKKIIDKVVPLVENHLNHIHHSNTPKKESFVKQLAERLHPSNIKSLENLIEADHSGRPPLPKQLPEEARLMSEIAKQHGVYEQKHPNFLEGKDVIPYTNGVASPLIGKILAEHRAMILNHHPEMRDRQSALNWLEKRMHRENKLINGNDVINTLGVEGPKVKEILDRGFQAQRSGIFNDRAGALDWLKEQNVV